MKPGRSRIMLELNEFDKLVKLIPQIESSIKRYELKDIGVSTTLLELDLPVFDLDKLECIDDVASVESIKEVERKLWLTHYYMLREKLMEVLRERDALVVKHTKLIILDMNSAHCLVQRASESMF